MQTIDVPKKNVTDICEKEVNTQVRDIKDKLYAEGN